MLPFNISLCAYHNRAPNATNGGSSSESMHSAHRWPHCAFECWPLVSTLIYEPQSREGTNLVVELAMPSHIARTKQKKTGKIQMNCASLQFGVYILYKCAIASACPGQLVVIKGDAMKLYTRQIKCNRIMMHLCGFCLVFVVRFAFILSIGNCNSVERPARPGPATTFNIKKSYTVLLCPPPIRTQNWLISMNKPAQTHTLTHTGPLSEWVSARAAVRSQNQIK